MVPWRVANLENLKPETEYRRTHKYYELPAALDVETSRTGTDPDKDFSFVYLWGFAIGEFVLYGRTLSELRDAMRLIAGELRLATDFRLVVYIHFLKYEFFFLKRELDIESAGFIARSEHEPLRVLVGGCMEFRDSYAYTEQPLEIMGREIGLHKVEGFDYDVMRTPETPLTADELYYQECDVLILTRYFERESSFYGGISRIPLTATQRVGRVISNCLSSYPDEIKWRVYNQQLDPRKEEERTTLHLLHIAFFGGFNYCSRQWAGKDICKVYDCKAYGVDIDTSYGAQCLLHRYPRRKFKPLPTMPDGIVPPSMLLDIKCGQGHYKNKALLITFEADEVKAKVPDMAFLPIYCKNYIHRDIERKKSMKSNHLSDCGHIFTVLTDIDFRLFLEWYDFAPDSLRIHSILASGYEPLPEYVITAIVDMVAQKKATQAELKDIEQYREVTEEEHAEYTRIKSMVSRIYGLFVKDPLRMDYTFDAETGEVKQAGIYGLDNYEEDKKKKFNPVLYQWGVWCASWARAEILGVISKLGQIGTEDKPGIRWNRRVLYSDTDSAKWFMLGNAAFDIVQEYNAKKSAQLHAFCERRNINEKWLEGLGQLKLETYSSFKAIGLKQYAEIKKGRFDYHVSGLPRMDFVKNPDGTERNRGCTFFDKWETAEEKMLHFVQEMEVPAEESHLNATYFIDGERSAVVTDRDGKQCEVSAKSCILIIPKEYRMNASLPERLKGLESGNVKLTTARNFEGRI